MKNSKSAPWLTEDDEPSTKAEWLKEAEPYVEGLRLANSDQVGRVIVSLFESIKAGK